MTVTVEVAGVELQGFHGVEDDERAAGQRFLFDVVLEVGDAAARTDRLEDAVDYRDVVAILREVSDARAYQLLEALAFAVAQAVLERLPAVDRVRVRVRKPDVRLTARVDHAAVTVECARS